MKASYVSTIYDRYGKYKDLVYSYRGIEYFVRVYFNGNAMGESMREQHEEAQKRIDKMLDEKQEQETYSGMTLDEIFELMDMEV